jgi:hypothetical protein
MHTEEHEHGHAHARPVEIIVNGRPRTVTTRVLTYEDVVALAYPGCTVDANIIFTVAYAGPGGRDGTLAEGQSVHVHDGMSFHVGKTGRS